MPSCPLNHKSREVHHLRNVGFANVVTLERGSTGGKKEMTGIDEL
jgi:hypothetical protein